VGGQNGIITGSVSYTSSFYGGLVFSGPTASVIFPTSSANFGTGSFTVELAFRPARIEGIHYLVSKNSGSFPNWGIYLSGSGGQGKLFSEFRISSTVSCSVSSSSTFVTGSNYQVDVFYYPSLSSSVLYSQGNILGGGLGNGGGSLTSTGSLLIGNIAPSSSQAFSGSLYNTKIYNTPSNTLPNTNYNAVATRLNLPPVLRSSTINIEYLVVAGGGSGGTTGMTRYETGGGGAGGLLTGSTTLSSNFTVTVGDGGTGTLATGVNGENSLLGSITSIGGGFGGNGLTGLAAAGNGGSGGGAVTTGQATGSGTPGQGNNGGTGGYGGGGGGAGTPSIGSNGGSGSFIALFANIGGSPAGWFAGGGAGSRGGGNSGNGGIGGGANGSTNSAPFTASANTGGGGGGAVSNVNAITGKGGSGIVSFRYLGPYILGFGGEITTSGSYIYHTYRTTGSSTFTIF
jgi:hypothetical protein